MVIKIFRLYGANALYALKGQKHLAEGNALGKCRGKGSPCKGKSIICLIGF